MSNTDGYSVWVGGVEVNDHALTYSQASILAEIYKEHGYTDVTIAPYTVVNDSPGELKANKCSVLTSKGFRGYLTCHPKCETIVLPG